MMSDVLTRTRALRGDDLQRLVRPIGIACMECLLELELPPSIREHVAAVAALLRDDLSTPEQLRTAAHAAAHAANAAHAAAHAAYAAAHAAYAAAYAANAAHAAAYAANAAHAANAAGHAANAAARELLMTKLALLVG